MVRLETGTQTKIRSHLSRITSSEGLQPDKAFCCIYGSVAYGADSPNSDLDLFFATDSENVTTENLNNLIDAVTDLHTGMERPLDDEVPLGNKLLYSFDEIKTATELECFKSPSGDFFIPPVIKDCEFLSSRNIRDRLVLNALTTPHIIFTQNKKLAEYFEKRAAMAITIVGIALAQTVERITINDIVDALLGEPDQEGELFLGYKRERGEVVRHLGQITQECTRLLVGSGIAPIIPQSTTEFIITDKIEPHTIISKLDNRGIEHE